MIWGVFFINSKLNFRNPFRRLLIQTLEPSQNDIEAIKHFPKQAAHQASTILVVNNDKQIISSKKLFQPPITCQSKLTSAGLAWVLLPNRYNRQLNRYQGLLKRFLIVRMPI